MNIQRKEVSRTVKTGNMVPDAKDATKNVQEELTRKTVVSFRAVTPVKEIKADGTVVDYTEDELKTLDWSPLLPEMLELAGGKMWNLAAIFDAGRWADLRTTTSNALAGKTAEQKAVDKMVEAYRAMMPALSEEAARQLILALPNMQGAGNTTVELVPAEISDTYFEELEAAKKAKKTESADSAVSSGAKRGK